MKEKIPWTLIGYNDNQQCLDLIGKRPFGIFHILDDECSFPNVRQLLKLLLPKVYFIVFCFVIVTNFFLVPNNVCVYCPM